MRLFSALISLSLVASAFSEEPTLYDGFSPEGYGRHLVFAGSGDETTQELAKIMAVRHGFRVSVFSEPLTKSALREAELLVISGNLDAGSITSFLETGRPVVNLGTSGHKTLDSNDGEKRDYRISGGRKGRVFQPDKSADLRNIANGIFWCFDMQIPAETDVSRVTDAELAEFQKPLPNRTDVDPGFEFANHATNQYRTYHWYRNQAAEAMRAAEAPAMLPTYPDIDGGVQGHWGVFHKNSYRDRRFNLAVHGRAVAGIFRAGKATLPRAIAIRISDDLSCAFDTETLRYAHFWKGDFVKFSSNRWGIGGGISPDGESVTMNTEWSKVRDGEFLGYHVSGDRVGLHLRIGGETFVEFPGSSADGKFTTTRADSNRGDTGKAGAPRFADQPITLSGKPGTQIPGSPFTIDRIPVPLINPFGSVMLLGGIDFFSNGDAAVCTMMGDVWRVTGLDETLSEVTWTRIATGINQALGLSIFEDTIYVVGRDRITRLHDWNNDGEIDFYENFCDDYPASPGGHDFYVGLQRDEAGYFYFVAANTGVVRVAPDGSSSEVLADGFRNANGIGVRKDGLVVASTNEGDWTPASAVMEIRQGDFYGRKAKKDGKAIAPAMVYLPRGIDNSSGGQIFCDSDKWGPMNEQLLHFSWGNGTWMMILRDEENGERTQGAAVPLPGDFESGAHRARFSPADGQLYVVGSDGWGNYAITDGSFARIRYDANTENHYPGGWKAHRNGIQVDFGVPLDPASVKAENVFCQAWNYTYGEHYGSLEFSLKNPEMPGHDVVPVKEAHLLNDGKSIFLEIPDLTPAMQFHIYGELTTASGVEFKLNMFPTLLRLADNMPQFPAAIPDKITNLELPIRWPVAFQPKVPNGKPGRELKIEAISGLRFSEKQLRAGAGEQISIRFQNMDSIPHNFVLCKPGSLETVGMESNKMLSNPKIAEMHYVPEMDEVLHYTPMLYTRSTYSLHIKAPPEPGIYPYICTFPGHWAVMKGELVIE